MNENFKDNYKNVEETATENSGSLSGNVSSVLDRTDHIAPRRTGEITVSGGDAETDIAPGIYVVDSADRVLYLGSASEISEMELVENETQSEVLFATDTIAVLERIDYKLSIIVFLLLFYWCAHKIKNAVRGFTGRGIDD